jgi:hypothetical protein
VRGCALAQLQELHSQVVGRFQNPFTLCKRMRELRVAQGVALITGQVPLHVILDKDFIPLLAGRHMGATTSSAQAALTSSHTEQSRKLQRSQHNELFGVITGVKRHLEAEKCVPHRKRYTGLRTVPTHRHVEIERRGAKGATYRKE